MASAFRPRHQFALFHHRYVFFDGTAAKNFHELFSDALLRVQAAKDASPLTVDPAALFSKSDLPDPTAILRFQPRSAPAALPPAASPLTLALSSDAMAALPMPLHLTEISILEKGQTAALVGACRRHGVRLTGFLYAVMAKAVCETVEAFASADEHSNAVSVGSYSPAASGAVFKAMIPINMRPPPPPAGADSASPTKRHLPLGLFFGKYFHSVPMTDVLSITNGDQQQGEAHLFALAQQFQPALEANIPHAMHDYEVFATSALADPSLIDAAMRAMAARNGAPLTTIAISNLGVVNSPIVDAVYFDQPIVDAYFSLNLISCSRGELTVNYEAHRAVDPAFFAMFVAKSKALISNVLSSVAADEMQKTN